MGTYPHRGFERPHHVVRWQNAGNTLFGGLCEEDRLKPLSMTLWEEPDEEKEMTHGNSVGQVMNFERGKTIRRVQRLVFEKTGDCVFAV